VARENLVETVVGAVVLAAAGGFLFYALGAGGVSRGGGGYQVTASFGQVGGLASGADVRVAGVKVGVVSGVELDPKTYLALTRFELDPPSSFRQIRPPRSRPTDCWAGRTCRSNPAVRSTTSPLAARSPTPRARWTCSG
jgi:hypothetical protein